MLASRPAPPMLGLHSLAFSLVHLKHWTRYFGVRRAIVARVARYKSVDSKIFWKKKLEPSLKEKWELFFEEPNKWWDKRKDKRHPRAADFVHKEKFYKLYGKDFEGNPYTVIPDLYERLGEIDDSPDTDEKPEPYPSEEETWRELFERPWLFADVRSKKQEYGKTSSPDFKSRTNNIGLWFDSAPQWVRERQADLEAYYLGRRPKLPIGIPAPEDEAELQPVRLVKKPEELKWDAEQKQKGVDLLMHFLEHDLTEEATPPQDLMRDGLFPYQKQGLAWMLKQEAAAHGPHGGMLCDEPGVGKTMQGIALIASNQCPAEEVGDLGDEWTADRLKSNSLACSSTARTEESPSDSDVATLDESAMDASGDPVGWDELLRVKGTLVVMPKGLLGQWNAALTEWAPQLKVLQYQGRARSKILEPGQLAEFDVVLTNYEILVSDNPRKGHRAPFKVQWWRVIMDEAQKFKERRSETAAAMDLLQTHGDRRRWVMTGTPIQNTPEELFSYLRFLRYSPFDDLKAFNDVFRKGNTATKIARLAAIVKPVMLRRTKRSKIDGVPILTLPRKSVAEHPVELSPPEKAVYKDIQRQFKEALKNEGRALERCECILGQVMQLRRACNHPILAKGYIEQLRVKGEGAGAPAVVLDYMHAQAVEENPSRSSKVQAVIDILRQYSGQQAPGAVCSRGLDIGCQHLLGCFLPNAAVLPSEKPTSAAKEAVTSTLNAAKPVVLSCLTQTQKLQPANAAEEEKVLVFSNWTAFLDLVESAMEEEGINFARLDGSMVSKKREEAVHDFQNNPDVRVFLISLGAGKEGLNLTAASRVIITEPHFNPMNEEQAMDRAHRVGQTKDVFVHKLYIKGTIEDGILDIQKHKMRESQAIIRESGETKRFTYTQDDLQWMMNLDPAAEASGRSYPMSGFDDSVLTSLLDLTDEAAIGFA